MLDVLRLPFEFDSGALRDDLEQVPEERYIRHFNNAIYEGDWSAAALRCPSGAVHPVQQIFAPPGTSEWEDTDLLGHCPAFAYVLSQLVCPQLSVRLLRLGPGARIGEHRDHALGFEDGEVRLHVPVATSTRVDFRLGGRRVVMAPGETWYVNVNEPHAVYNGGENARVHLVIDCVVNSWLRSMMQHAARRCRQRGEGDLAE